jgi:hypothetical protein
MSRLHTITGTRNVAARVALPALNKTGGVMKRHKCNRQILLVLIAVSFLALHFSALAQSVTPSKTSTAKVKTNCRILYHDGPVVTGTAGVYFVWYGCWEDVCGAVGDSATKVILADFMENLGGSPYFQINATYPNSNGQAPSGGLLYGGSVVDRYSHGAELTASDIQGIVADQIVSGRLPQDPSGIYVVLASADVTSPTTGLCVPSARPHHGQVLALGSYFPYAFVGNPMRCPTVGAPQFVSGGDILPTPNENVTADAMASTLARVLDAIVTDPSGGGWFDRYGLENADKCQCTFGKTYTTANGAQANMRLGQRDYLIQQNWVNAPDRGYCGLSLSTP